MILVTGGAGYVGSHCVLELLKEDYDVLIFDNLSTGHIETIETLKNFGNVEFIHGDLINENSADEIFAKRKIDAVLHFAAYSQVGESVTNPQKYYINNVVGTLNLLKAMLKNNVKKIIFSSTAAIYGNPKYTPIDEKHSLNPINTYGKTKLFIEKILEDYDKVYDLKSVRLRYFNVVGANSNCLTGEWHTPETHLIPNILKSTFENKKTFKLYGTDYETKDGTCVRDYINVEDLANAHILALKYLENGGISDYFNLGSKEGHTVKEVFAACEKIVGKTISVEISTRRDGDTAILVADNKKAEKILGWKPQKTLNDSIQTAYRWENKLLNKNLLVK